MAPNSYNKKGDPTLNWFYTRHTITVLVGILAYFLYVAYFSSIENNFIQNSKKGIEAAIIVFLFIGLTQFSDGPFSRPHPAIWRVVLAISVVYLLFLVFTLFQNVHDARNLLKYLDPSLGVSLPEKSYAENCAITVKNLYEQMDAFVVAHTLGWFVKALILRDFWMLWIISILFEFCEYSLQHQLPNFAECWWDHWILDVLVCNFVGILLGMKTCQYFQMKEYSWRGLTGNISGKVKRSVQQFIPEEFASFHWFRSAKSVKHYISAWVIIFAFLAAELNAFYLKYLLWIPATHVFNSLRLCLIAACGSVGIRECYQFFSDPACKRLGPQAWVAIAIVFTETLICIKFSRGAFPQPFPLPVVIGWSVFFTILAIFGVWRYWISPLDENAAQLSLSKKTKQK